MAMQNVKPGVNQATYTNDFHDDGTRIFIYDDEFFHDEHNEDVALVGINGHTCGDHIGTPMQDATAEESQNKPGIAHRLTSYTSVRLQDDQNPEQMTSAE